MSEASQENKDRPASAWNLAANPIFRRYCKSQLRPISTGIWIVTVLVVITFVFLAIYIGTTNVGQKTDIQGARLAMIGVLAVQGLLLMLIGTGATTLAYVREADEKITDYQRLTPMTPLAKVFGYLFGPSIRSYLLVALTMPFAIFCIVKGQIPMVVVAQSYTIFFVSGILYHLTGLLAGTVLKRKLMAGILSMGLVFCINFVLPAILTRSGYKFLFYTTVWPVLQLHGSGMILEDREGEKFRGREELEAFNESSQSVDFFAFEIPTFTFSLVVQGFLVFTVALIIWRKWKGENMHLLGKNFSLIVFAGILVLFLGTSLPLMDSGQIFPSMSTEFGRNYMRPTGTQATLAEGMGVAAACGAVTLIIANILIQMITPSRDGFIRGLRRADKVGRTRARFGSDPGSALWHTIIIALLGASAWFWFTNNLIESKWYPEKSLPGFAPTVMAAIFVFAAICFCATLQMFGKGILWLGMLFAWIVPLLAAGICFISDQYIAGIYLTSPSPFGAFFNSLAVLLDAPEFENLKHVKTAFWIWVAIYALFTTILVAVMQSRQAHLRQLVLNESKEEND